MDAETYNQKQIDTGRLTLQHVTQLITEFQDAHDLAVDGKCGPNTIAALEALNAPVSGASDLGWAALGVARENLGQGETGGNNSGPFVEMLHGKAYDGNTDDDGAWCAVFVSFCFIEASKRIGVDMPFTKSGGAKALFKKVSNAGRVTMADTTQPNELQASIKPGDVVCWHRGDPKSWTGHVGIVERVGAGVVHTIEGNVGRFPSKVRRFIRELDDPMLIGFARV